MLSLPPGLQFPDGRGVAPDEGAGDKYLFTYALLSYQLYPRNGYQANGRTWYMRMTHDSHIKVPNSVRTLKGTLNKSIDVHGMVLCSHKGIAALTSLLLP